MDLEWTNDTIRNLSIFEGNDVPDAVIDSGRKDPIFRTLFEICYTTEKQKKELNLKLDNSKKELEEKEKIYNHLIEHLKNYVRNNIEPFAFKMD